MRLGRGLLEALEKLPELLLGESWTRIRDGGVNEETVVFRTCRQRGSEGRRGREAGVVEGRIASNLKAVKKGGESERSTRRERKLEGEEETYVYCHMDFSTSRWSSEANGVG